MKFGREYGKSSYEHCKKEKRAQPEKETFEKGILYYGKLKIVEVIGP